MFSFGDAYDSLMFHFEDVKLPYLSGVHLLEPNVLGGSIFYCSYQVNIYISPWSSVPKLFLEKRIEHV